MKPAYVFHLNKVFFEMIKNHEKNKEFRPLEKKYAKIPLLKEGDIIRFDLGYASLKEKEKHIFRKIVYTTTWPLYELPEYVKSVYPKHGLRELFHVVEFTDI